MLLLLLLLLRFLLLIFLFWLDIKHDTLDNQVVLHPIERIVVNLHSKRIIRLILLLFLFASFLSFGLRSVSLIVGDRAHTSQFNLILTSRQTPLIFYLIILIRHPALENMPIVFVVFIATCLGSVLGVQDLNLVLVCSDRTLTILQDLPPFCKVAFLLLLWRFVVFILCSFTSTIAESQCSRRRLLVVVHALLVKH